MKDVLSFLPQHKQTDLNLIVGLIKGTMPEAGMVILYGSYARNSYVDFDSRIDYGVPTTFQSDYDILVITYNMSKDVANSKIDKIVNQYRSRSERTREHPTPLQIIHHDIEQFNKDVSDGRYFYTQLKKEGIILYDKGIFKLEEPRDLRFDEIRDQAKAYFKTSGEKITEHIDSARILLNSGKLNLSVFLLHQAMENIYHSVLLVFTLYSPKQHNLKVLNEDIYKYAPLASLLFSGIDKNEEVVRLFEKLTDAYVAARYNPEYDISRKEIEMILEKVNEVLKAAIEANSKQIEHYSRSFLGLK